MIITWLGHACFMLESGGYRVIIDPCEGVPGVPNTAGEAEAVFCSHGHHDHCYTAEIRLTEGKISPFTVREIAAFHDDQGGTLRGANTIRVFTAEGVTVAHMGDLGHQLTAEQLAALGRVDILLLPVGGTYTVDAQEAKAVAEAVKPRVICPMHYRKGAMGYEVLGTDEDFSALYPTGEVHRPEGCAVTVTKEFLDRGGVVFFDR